MERDFLAALLSLIAPGMGHALIGRQRYGFVLLALALGATVVIFVLSSIMSALFGWQCVPLLLLGLIVGIAIRVYAVFAAGRDAHRLSGPLTQHAPRRVVIFGLVAVLAGLLVRTLVTQSFKAPSGAMAPTLQIGDHFLVNKLI